MDKWKGKVAVVTGASSGIGATIARVLVQHGMTVVGLARRQEKVKKLASELQSAKAPGTLHALKVDLRNEEDVLGAWQWVKDNLGGADVLVNNAGVAYGGTIIEGKTEEWRALLEVNVLAVTICTREFLKSMEERNNQNGHIFIIDSVAAHVTDIPHYSIYCGSKQAVRAISMCLRRELALKKSTIKVTNVSPGTTATEAYAASGFNVDFPTLRTEDVAAVIVDALSASQVAEICEVVLNPVPTSIGIY